MHCVLSSSYSFGNYRFFVRSMVLYFYTSAAANIKMKTSTSYGDHFTGKKTEKSKLQVQPDRTSLFSFMPEITITLSISIVYWKNFITVNNTPSELAVSKGEVDLTTINKADFVAFEVQQKSQIWHSPQDNSSSSIASIPHFMLQT